MDPTARPCLFIRARVEKVTFSNSEFGIRNSEFGMPLTRLAGGTPAPQTDDFRCDPLWGSRPGCRVRRRCHFEYCRTLGHFRRRDDSGRQCSRWHLTGKPSKKSWPTEAMKRECRSERHGLWLFLKDVGGSFTARPQEAAINNEVAGPEGPAYDFPGIRRWRLTCPKPSLKK
jgi:hypothetical protein